MGRNLRLLGMIKTLLLALCALSAHAQLSMGFMASTTTWGTGFYDLQTPGWVAVAGGHPGGLIDLQWKSGYLELGGDPHRPREASSILAGLRHDLYHRGRVHLYGQVSAGVFMAPSFNEYCWSYEYENGDCGAGLMPPEYCWWFTTSVGGGARIQIKPKFSLEPARFEYLAVYGIGPRYRFSAGFRVGL